MSEEETSIDGEKEEKEGVEVEENYEIDENKLQSLPFRIIVDIITSSDSFEELEIIFDDKGKIFQYVEGADDKNFRNSSKRTYLSISHLIKLLYGCFKMDRFRKPFLLHASLTFGGERYISGCSYMSIEGVSITKLDKNVMIPIPRKVKSLMFTSLHFSDKNIPVVGRGSKMEFLESIDCDRCQIDSFSKTFSKFSSLRLKDVSFDETKGSDPEFDESFLDVLLNLEYLSFRKCDFLEGDLIEKIVSFKEKTKLGTLTFSFKKSNLDPFFKNYCLNVKSLNISGSSVTERIFEYISKNPHLKDFCCFRCELGVNGIINIFESKSIENLVIGENSVNFELFNNIENLKKVKNNTLKSFRINRNWHNPPTNEFFEYISQNLICLEKLYLYEDEINDSHMKHICKIRSLKTLNLDYNSVTRESIPLLLNLNNLEYLNLSGCNIIDEDLKTLCKLEKLETLNIALNKVTDNCVEYLIGSNIKEINVHYTKMTIKVGIEKLKSVESIERIIFGEEIYAGTSKYWARDPNEEDFFKYF